MTRSIRGEVQAARDGATGPTARRSPSVAAAVVTYNHRDAVLELLRFLDARQIPTFVTENACSDGTRDAIRGRFASVSLLESEANLGGCGGFDCAMLAALSAGTEYILLIDDDALPADDCIERLARFLDAHAEYVFAAPAVYIAAKANTLQEAGGGVDFESEYPVQAWHRFEVDPELPEHIDIQYASACCLMVRAEAVMRLGVMDWNYFIFSDDVDWSLRLRRAFGRKAACVTTAKVVHDFPWAKPFSPMRLYFFQRNGLYLLSRLRGGQASRRAVHATVMRLLRQLIYARLIGDHETARTLRDALLDARRGRFGRWTVPVRFPEDRRQLDAAFFRQHGITRVLVDLVIEDLDVAIVRTIRELGGDGVTVDVLCDPHRVAANREKALFGAVHGRLDGTFGRLKDFLAMRRRAYDLVVTDASMEPRRPSGTSGRHAAFFHDGALYEARAVGAWSCVAQLTSGLLAQMLAGPLHHRFLVPPPPGVPPSDAGPLLERIGIRPEVGQPWARDWLVPFPTPRATEAAVLQVPAPHVRADEPAWTPLHPLRSLETDDEYAAWRAARERSAAMRYAGIPPGTRFSVIVSGTDGVEAAIASVRAQTYPAWELVVVEPGEDEAAARNRAAQEATGEHLVFLEAGDVLDRYALAAFAQANAGAADVIYADEDRLDPLCGRIDPDFKPDFSPAKLAAANYIGRPVAIRRALFDRVGGWRGDHGARADHDLLLRATGAARQVVHLADVLCHRRLPARAAASAPEIAPHVGSGNGAGRARPRSAPEPTAEVSVLVVREGPSSEEELAGIWAGCECLVEGPGAAPRPERLNALAARASGEVLLVASSALRPRDGWREGLLAAVLDPAIGIVGGTLRYHDGRLHSAGLVLGIAGAVGRWHHGQPPADAGHGGWIALPHEVSAVPFQFLAVRRDLLLAQGGFDAAFRHRGFDTDLALRLTARQGLRHLHVAATGASFVRGYPEAAPEPWPIDDLVLLWERWGRLIRRGDPYSNLNVSLLTEEVHITTQEESDLRARGGLMAYDRCTAERLAQRFPGRVLQSATAPDSDPVRVDSAVLTPR